MREEKTIQPREQHELASQTTPAADSPSIIQGERQGQSRVAQNNGNQQQECKRRNRIKFTAESYVAALLWFREENSHSIDLEASVASIFTSYFLWCVKRRNICCVGFPKKENCKAMDCMYIHLLAVTTY